MLTASKSNARIRAQRLTDRRWTFDELAAEVPESNQPMELWDGELIKTPAPSFFHQEVVGRFHDLLKAWVRSRRLGKTVASPIDMILTSRRVTQPDVLFISNERLHIVEDRVIKIEENGVRQDCGHVGYDRRRFRTARLTSL